ncbi:MAG: DUF808 family protein [Bacteriovoracaceae bacterium]|jgi:predicted DNA repair protein MutK|nr:DUF808 family protein [Bacteriovoracaceae bacterium]
MGSNLLSLLDDIALLMDDVSILTKVALKKTSGIITDDLAVNIGQVDGVSPSQEIPTVIKIFLGSLINKIIIIPFILLLNFYAPIVLKFILLFGGFYLAYEGTHKIIEKLFYKKNIKKEKRNILNQDEVKKRIIGAIKTDFVLSIEILVIAQSTLTGPLIQQSISLAIIGFIVSLLIYGIVAFLVKVDDFGIYLIKKSYIGTGKLLVVSMPKIMKLLSFVGIMAMLLVGGEIISHHFHIKDYLLSIAQFIIIGLTSGLIIHLLFSIKNKITKISH